MQFRATGLCNIRTSYVAIRERCVLHREDIKGLALPQKTEHNK